MILQVWLVKFPTQGTTRDILTSMADVSTEGATTAGSTSLADVSTTSTDGPTSVVSVSTLQQIG